MKRPCVASSTCAFFLVAALFFTLFFFCSQLGAQETSASQAASTNTISKSALLTKNNLNENDFNESDVIEPDANTEASVRDFTPWQEGATALGDWGGYRTKLSKKGIEIGLSSVEEAWGNTVGGLKRGAVATGLIQLATAVDLEKLMQWKGASFYSRWACITGQDPGTTLTGDLFGVSNIAGLSTFRNIELWGQQNFLEDKISIRAGQIVADSEFVISDYAALFINNTFGWPAFLFLSVPNGGPAYPMGAPGIRVKLQPTESFSLKAAVFQGVYAQTVNTHGFYWDFNQASGLFYIGEAAYRYKCSTLPGQVKAGVWGSADSFVNQASATTSLNGDYGIYGIIDQMIYRQPTACDKSGAENKNVMPSGDDKKVVEPPSDLGLGTFARVAFEPADRNLMTFYFDTGFNYKGLLPKRESDVFGVAMTYGGMSSSEIETIQQSYGTAPASMNIIFETTYQAQITPFLSIQPNIQYIIHPGTVQNLPNALVLGIRASVTF
jgi:porin